nr:toll/interleukin-1 receptor domain-containing protein [Candidatus Sigynarchaeota archaeon]
MCPSRRADGTLVFKLFFWGPSESGRRTALNWLHDYYKKRADPIQSISDPIGRVFSCEFRWGSSVVYQIYIIDGLNVQRHFTQIPYINGTDAIVFFWNSESTQWNENVYGLKTILQLYGVKILSPDGGKTPPEVPLVLSANKRDVTFITPIDKIKDVLKAAKMPNTVIFETVAITGTNILRTFVYAARECLLRHYQRLRAGGTVITQPEEFEISYEKPRLTDEALKGEIEAKMVKANQLITQDRPSEAWQVVRDAQSDAEQFKDQKLKAKYNPHFIQAMDDARKQEITGIIARASQFIKESQLDEGEICAKSALPLLQDIFLDAMKKDFETRIESVVQSIQKERIKVIIQNLAKKYSRLHILEIAEEINKDEVVATEIIKEMIANQEIKARYFMSTRFYLFASPLSDSATRADSSSTAPDAIPIPFHAYEGIEPYIFVSYAHKDKMVVFPDLASLKDKGYRIWYDEGIKPSEQWLLKIADALQKSKYFIVFISPVAIVSKFLKMEVLDAFHNNLPILPVYLQETRLPRDLEMLIQGTQYLFKYKLPDDEYWKQIECSLPANTKT